MDNCNFYVRGIVDDESKILNVIAVDAYLKNNNSI
jgi:hypothetical protein